MYVSDDAAGFTRRRAGKGFAYYDRNGNLIREPNEKSLLEFLKSHENTLTASPQLPH